MNDRVCTIVWICVWICCENKNTHRKSETQFPSNIILFTPSLPSPLSLSLCLSHIKQNVHSVHYFFIYIWYLLPLLLMQRAKNKRKVKSWACHNISAVAPNTTIHSNGTSCYVFFLRAYLCFGSAFSSMLTCQRIFDALKACTHIARGERSVHTFIFW